MKKQNDLIIPAQALGLARFLSGDPLHIHIGENTLAVLPESMTAMEAVNAVHALSGLTAELIEAVQTACGGCEDQMEREGCPFGEQDSPDECPYEGMEESDVILSSQARRRLGIPKDAKLELLPDVHEGLVCAADYDHDITDVPDEVLTVLDVAGVCRGRLDELLKDGSEVWHG